MFEPLPALIRSAREQQNLTQAQLARRSGVSRGTIIAFEQGDANITLTVLVKLARALELVDLRFGNVRMRAAPPEFNVLHEAQHEITMARQVIGFAKAELARVTERLDQIVSQLALAIDADGVNAYIERLGLEPAEKRAAIPHATAVATPIPASARPNMLTKTSTKRGRRKPSG